MNDQNGYNLIYNNFSVNFLSLNNFIGYNFLYQKNQFDFQRLKSKIPQVVLKGP